MKYISLFALTIVSAFSLASCDEGNIYPSEYDNDGSDARIVHLTGKLTGAATLPQGYSLVLAGFEEGADYTALQKNVEIGADGKVDMTLSAKQSLTDFELCVTNSVRKRIASLATITAEGNGETTFDVGNTDVSGLSIIQQAIFTPSCASCHATASGRNANLCLAPGKSESNLIGVASQRLDGAQRVQPGNPSASVLHQVIENNIPEVAMPHADILDAKKKSDLLELLDAWIKGL